LLIATATLGLHRTRRGGAQNGAELDEIGRWDVFRRHLPRAPTLFLQGQCTRWGLDCLPHVMNYLWAEIRGSVHSGRRPFCHFRRTTPFHRILAISTSSAGPTARPVVLQRVQGPLLAHERAQHLRHRRSHHPSSEGTLCPHFWTRPVVNSVLPAATNAFPSPFLVWLHDMKRLL